jgi:hypothetical protein
MRDGKISTDTLDVVAQLCAPWPTPKATNATGASDTETRQGAPDLQTVAGWCSPTATDGQRGTNPPRPHDTGIPLSQQVAGLGWATPKVTDNKGDTYEATENRRAELRKQAFGLTPAPSSAETGSFAGFQLNPRFSLWLMGYPTSWHDAGAYALRCSREPETPSSRK